MTDRILTFIAAGYGSLTPDDVAQVRRKLGDMCAEVAPPVWLSHSEACDISLHGLHTNVSETDLRSVAPGRPIDILVQPPGPRKKKLLLADMDSTIIIGETLDEVARAAGVYEKVADLTRQAMNGEMDFHAALHERVSLLEGLSTSVLEDVWQTINLTEGAETVIKTMQKHGAFCVLASGGFTFFAERVAKKCGFNAYHANQLDIRETMLTGHLQGPIFDHQAKNETLHTYCTLHGVPLDKAMAVGDGANDLPMLKTAGLGIAYHAKPRVRSAIAHQLNFANLTGLLFAQGYHRDEFL